MIDVLDTNGQHPADHLCEAVSRALTKDPTKRVCVVLQRNPDPDALGSALGVKWLLSLKCQASCDLFYSGEVSHPQNRTEVNVLEIHLNQASGYDPKDYCYHIVVDSPPQNTGEFETLVAHWDAIIDHHQFDLQLPHTDIRSVGSCSSIVWSYLNHAGVSFESEKGQQIATALLFGVVNDTMDLMAENVSKLDLAAHADLFPYIDKKKYHSILQYPLPQYLFELRAKAAENMTINASALVSYVGILTDQRRDALPMIADEFLRMEGVETVVVFAKIGAEIAASVRSSNSSVNVHTFCQRIFGAQHGGGKYGAGGARVPIGFLYSPDDPEERQQDLSDFVRDLITGRIIRYLSGE
jgi:nanoRNase/pAp phosphatase (c-di-AMP/oligoRNAs hydrolase)